MTSWMKVDLRNIKSISKETCEAYLIKNLAKHILSYTIMSSFCYYQFNFFYWELSPFFIEQKHATFLAFMPLRPQFCRPGNEKNHNSSFFEIWKSCPAVINCKKNLRNCNGVHTRNDAICTILHLNMTPNNIASSKFLYFQKSQHTSYLEFSSTLACTWGSAWKINLKINFKNKCDFCFNWGVKIYAMHFCEFI